MTTLLSLLSAMMAILQAHPLCKKVSAVETKEFSPDQFFFKVRADLKGKHKLQVRIYFNHGHLDYAYQLFTDVPLLRWDNKEEFRHLATYPHHHHDDRGHVRPSPLIGDPVRDIEVVLQKVSEFLATK
ncbi:hypothetical protein HYR99_16080 [Candidatus Poribacteria bacterium]|nr:hypothetical protein [Candidatus Poribacteria bacterium]